MKKALILSGGDARGTFQLGVWKYLREVGWTPDLICGTSAGAINAVAIGAGMPLERLIQVWHTDHTPRLYRRNLVRFLATALFGRPPAPILDTSPLRMALKRHLDIAALRRSPMEITITAIQVATGRLHVFDQTEITIEHVLAACAVPILFACQPVGGQLYWDGGVMANTPLFPALARGAEEIIVVLHSPVGHAPLPLPDTLLKRAELVFEHLLIGSYQTTLIPADGSRKGAFLPLCTADTTGDRIIPRILTVAPRRMLGFRSFFSFSGRLATRLINEGYHSAHTQLGHRL